MMVRNLFIKLNFIGELLYFLFSRSTHVDDSGPKWIETDGCSGNIHEIEHITSHRYHILPIYCCLWSWMFSLNSTDSSKNCHRFYKCNLHIHCAF